jgi:hypothetical protein
MEGIFTAGVSDLHRRDAGDSRQREVDKVIAAPQPCEKLFSRLVQPDSVVFLGSKIYDMQ